MQIQQITSLFPVFCYLVTIWQKANHHVGDSNISISIQETGQPHSCSLCEPVSWYSASSWCWWDLSISSSVLSLASTASPVGPVLRCYHPPPFTSKLTLSHLSVLTSAVCPVLPASFWFHLKTLFSTALKPITALSTHKHANPATQTYKYN